MKVFLAMLMAVFAVTAAPTFPSSVVTSFKAGTIDTIMEDMCFDMSQALCATYGGYLQYGTFDPAATDGICTCSEQPSAYILESRCAGVVCPSAEPRLLLDVSADKCVCMSLKSHLESIVKSDASSGALKSSLSPGTLRVEQRLTDLVAALNVWKELGPTKQEQLGLTRMVHAVLDQLHIMTKIVHGANQDIREKIVTLTEPHFEKRQEPVSTFSTSIDPAAPTFIPPPKTDITPELINQSLSAQTDNTGVVTGAIPLFMDGVITFPVQLEGPVAPIIPINCSTSLPCGAIGNGPDPNILITPKYVQNGTQQTVVADCVVIAVNMYDPKVINYVIQNSQGEIYSLVGSNKIHDMDKIDTGSPIALSLLSSLTAVKRDAAIGMEYVSPQRRQMHMIDCHAECTRRGYFIQDLEDFCSCMDQEGEDDSVFARSGISAPDMTEATMSAEACAAMTCINNGDQPAMFNPYSLTCWCVDEAFIEENPSGWAGRARSLISRALQLIK